MLQITKILTRKWICCIHILFCITSILFQYGQGSEFYIHEGLFWVKMILGGIWGGLSIFPSCAFVLSSHKRRKRFFVCLCPLLTLNVFGTFQWPFINETLLERIMKKFPIYRKLLPIASRKSLMPRSQLFYPSHSLLHWWLEVLGIGMTFLGHSALAWQYSPRLVHFSTTESKPWIGVKLLTRVELKMKIGFSSSFSNLAFKFLNILET